MPLYEYQCKDCDRTFEIIQKLSDPEVGKCTECGGKLERLLSAPAIQFKGSGWYITDYARKGTESGNSNSEGKDSGSKKNADQSDKTAKADKTAAE